ncbi:MAG TPA: leucine-rich repeat domain-containing protein, partial [Candidatus Lokiarchaeia archaeon]|nr:leucine-rich repeat domain-containing protein [Candidatus Lokiarchaeia archaeon]
EVLLLNDNQLSSFPESFGQLTHLQRLTLNNNQLTSLPESFDQLSRLQSLNLDNNPISSLHESPILTAALNNWKEEQTRRRKAGIFTD